MIPVAIDLTVINSTTNTVSISGDVAGVPGTRYTITGDAVVTLPDALTTPVGSVIYIDQISGVGSFLDTSSESPDEFIIPRYQNVYPNMV
jgi:hypothetical protein